MTVIRRQELLHILYSSLKDHSKILKKRKVVRIDHTDTGISVWTADGSIYHGDTVVGTDGVHSVTRSEVWRIANREKPGFIPPADKTSKFAWRCEQALRLQISQIDTNGCCQVWLQNTLPCSGFPLGTLVLNAASRFSGSLMVRLSSSLVARMVPLVGCLYRNLTKSMFGPTGRASPRTTQPGSVRHCWTCQSGEIPNSAIFGIGGSNLPLSASRRESCSNGTTGVSYA